MLPYSYSLADTQNRGLLDTIQLAEFGDGCVVVDGYTSQCVTSLYDMVFDGGSLGCNLLILLVPLNLLLEILCETRVWAEICAFLEEGLTAQCSR